MLPIPRQLWQHLWIIRTTNTTSGASDICVVVLCPLINLKGNLSDQTWLERAHGPMRESGTITENWPIRLILFFIANQTYVITDDHLSLLHDLTIVFKSFDKRDVTRYLKGRYWNDEQRHETSEMRRIRLAHSRTRWFVWNIPTQDPDYYLLGMSSTYGQ